MAVRDGGTIRAEKNEFIVLYRDPGQGNGSRAPYLAELPSVEHAIILTENYPWDGELRVADQTDAIATGATKVILELSKSLPH